jgi:hypothetical protein
MVSIMKYRNTLILIALILFIWSCGESNKKDEGKSEQVEMSNLEKEHLLEKEAYADSVNMGLMEDTFKGSARRETKGKVGSAQITVNYGSPGKRGRVIWNGLVSYDQVWVSGSHWATAVTFSDDVMIGGKDVSAGMYGFFTIPGREEWILILNKNYDQHLADDYDERGDVARVTVTPKTLDETVQRLSYTIDETSNRSGNLNLTWDQIKVSLPIESKN